MTLHNEIRKTLANIQKERQMHERKAAALKQQEERLRQLASEFSSALKTQSLGRPMSEEHRRKISEAMKRRFAKN